MKKIMPRLFWCFCLALSASPLFALAENLTTLKMSGFAEAGASHASLSNGNGDWNDYYLRGQIQVDPANSFNGEVSRQSHFGDRGTYVGAGYTHIFNDTWHGSLNVGTSDGGFFLPRLRMDGFLYHKWLESKNLVTSVGLIYYNAKEIYSDRALLLGAAYYFDAPWIVEAGARFNQSNPGGVQANRGFAALTWGRDKQRYVTLRYESGREAYQLIGFDSALSDFSSREWSAVWRQWIGREAGFNVRATHYENPNYVRSGIEFGLFHDL